MAENTSQKLRHVSKSAARREPDISEGSPLLHSATMVSDSVNTSTHSDVGRTTGGVQSRLTHCRTACARRPLPRGKGLLLLLFVYFVESFAFYCATKSIRELLFKDETKQVWRTFLYSLIYNSLGRLFYPLAGVLADTFWGRHKVIEIGLWLIGIGLGLVCINLSVLDMTVEAVGRVFLPSVCVVFIAVGSACVEVNAVSFGVDQLPQGCTSDQISSYFLWYYFIRNASTLLAIISFIAIENVHLFFSINSVRMLQTIDLHYKTIIASFVATVVTVFSLLLHYCKQSWYFKNSQRDNPVKTVINVSWYSLTVKRHLPVYKRTYRYGEPKKPRIELAKIEYDGIFESEIVENVKSFYQILLLILSLGGYFASYNGASSMLLSQFDNKDFWKTSKLYHILAPYFNTFVDVLTIVVFLPIFNHLILPFFPRLNMSIKLRIGIGLIFNFLAILIAVFLQATVELGSGGSMMSKFLWLLLPAILLSVGEALTFISCLEFIYAQAPEPMKGLLTGLFYFMFGVFSGVSSMAFYFFPFETIAVEDIRQSFIFWYYVLLLILAALGLLMYGLAVWLYQNRLRPALDEEDLQRRIIAQDVYFGNNNNNDD